MEPVSIASAAAAITACVRLSTQLYTWIDEIRNVDGTLGAFFSEVNALAAVLEVVKLCSQHALVANVSERQDDRVCWDLVQKTLEDCATAVAELGQILIEIGGRRRLGQLITNSVFNLKSRKLGLLRQKIQNYTTVLQMAMQMINDVIETP
jgi:hypothetical protein